MARAFGFKTRSKLAVSVLALATAMAAAGTASAEDAAPATGGDVAQVAEVVVTARKKEERLQDVPIPVTAISGDTISSKAATNLTDLSNSVPNVKLETVGLFPNASSFTMRGIGTNAVESYQDPRVALYVNGVYQSRTQSGPGDLFDIESVEILRGPQGALYGRNAFAGAVAMTTRRPDGSYGGRAEATVGNYGRFDFQAAVNLPIVEDKLDLRLAYMHREWDGFFKVGNTNPNFTTAQLSSMVGRDLSEVIGDRAGGDQKNLFRGTLTYRPVEGVVANLIVTHVEEDGDGSPQINQTLAGSVFSAVGFPGRNPFGDGKLGVSGDGSDPFVTGSSAGNYVNQSGTDYTADLSVDAFGGNWYTVVNYADNDSVIRTDTDGELVDLFTSTRIERFNQFQIESRYSHKFFDNRVDVMGGVFYVRDEFDVFQRLSTGFGNAADPTANPPILATPLYQFPTDGRASGNVMQKDGQVRSSISPFLQVNWNVTDKLRLNAAIRYSKEERDAYNFPLQTPGGNSRTIPLSTNFDTLNNGLVLPVSCGTEHFETSSVSPGLSVDYKIQPDVMVFASWQRAYKSGGINVNGTCTSFHQPYQDERVDNYEVGIKSQFFDRRLMVNLNAFRAEYSNLQESIIRVDPNNTASAETFTSNAAGAVIYGVEAEIQARPIRNLTLYATVGYLHASYSEFCANLVGVTSFTGAAPTSNCGAVTILSNPVGNTPGQAYVDSDYSNLQLPFAPEWDGQIGATYKIDMDRAGELSFDASVHYSSRLETQVTNAPFTSREPLTKVDASIGWRDADQKYRVTLWGKNLGDQVERQTATYVSPLFIFATPTEPRTFGVTLSADF